MIQTMGSVSEAAARDDSVEVGDKDIRQAGATGIRAKRTRMKGSTVVRGGKGIH